MFHFLRNSSQPARRKTSFVQASLCQTSFRISAVGVVRDDEISV